ncbi:MAG: hypothetical protein JF616_04885 [Fibrobacteres bacterium]|nr:hypothetical protein [Fibrobacterota bacterium]
MKWHREAAASLLWLGLFLLPNGCKEAMKVIYSERIALLPDATGLLVKEMRADAEGKTFLAIVETRGEARRELVSAPMGDVPEVKFHSEVRGDTVFLFHTIPAMKAGLSPASLAGGGYTIRLLCLDEVRWLATGTEEGSAIFYAPDKWKAYLELSRRR